MFDLQPWMLNLPPSCYEFAILLSNLYWLEYQLILHPARMRAMLHQISSMDGLMIAGQFMDGFLDAIASLEMVLSFT